MSENPQKQFNFAQQLYRQARFVDSEKVMLQLVKGNSKIPEFFNFLALTQLNQNKINEAEKNFKKALKLKPIFPEASSGYALVFIKRGEFISAKKHLEIALRYDDSIPETSLNLALVMYELNQEKNAINLLQSFLKKDSNNIEILNALALGYSKLSNHELALITIKKIEKINPSRVPYFNQAKIYEKLYQFEDAIFSYKNELSKNPSNHLCLLALADLWYKNLYDEDKAIKIINDYLSSTRINQNNKNKIYNKIGNIFRSKSMEKKAIANYKKVLTSSHDNDFFIALNAASTLKSFDCEPYLKEANKRLGECDCEANWMYFSTLANNYEKKHDIENFITALKKSNKYNMQTSNRYYKKKHKKNDEFRILNLILNKTSCFNINSKLKNVLDFTPIFVVGMPRSGTSLLEQMLANHPKVFGAGEVKFFSTDIYDEINKQSSDDEYLVLINKIKNNYKKNLSSILSKYNYIVDKNPFNFRFIDIILNSFEGCKILHISRQPQAVCWSIYRNSFGNLSQGWTSDMDQIIRYYQLYEKIMDKWYQEYGKNIYSINYEILSSDPEKEMKRILEICGLEWNRNCIDLGNNSRSIRTLSSGQVRGEIFKGSSELWKNYSQYFPQLTDVSIKN